MPRLPDTLDSRPSDANDAFGSSTVTALTPGSEPTTWLRASSWSEALELKAARPDATPISGGTDLMVEINFAYRRPSALLDLSHLDELRRWELIEPGNGHRPFIRLGAGVTYRTIVDELADLSPALAMASRTVGSPQIRNRGTVGGNLGTASPAGDAHPPLMATRALIEIESVGGQRLVSIDDFFVGPKRNVLASDELIRAVRIPAADGPQQFSKIGPRNAMVIATTSFALCIDRPDRRVGTGIGSAGPTPLRAPDAEAFLEYALADRWETLAGVDTTIAHRFGDLVAAAASPIDDIRGTASYRRHALSVLARRCVAWACNSGEGAHQ